MDFDPVQIDAFITEFNLHRRQASPQSMAPQQPAKPSLLESISPKHWLKHAEHNDEDKAGIFDEFDEHVLEPIQTKVLFDFLSLFINGPTTNDFTMQPLPNNKNVKKQTIQGLYEIAVTEPGYALRMKLLDFVMEQLHVDMDMSNDDAYENLVLGLLNNRQPVTEVGTFGDLKQFLQREGSFWLQPNGNGYEIDLTRYANYAVRPGYETYGCKAEFDQEGNATRIDGATPDDAEFGRKLAVFQSTLVLDIILHCHAIFSHLLISQRLYMAVTTKYYDLVSADPVLNQFYYLITYRTNDINSKIPVLAGNQGSLIQMGFGFQADSFLAMMSDLYKSHDVQNQAGIKDFLLTSRCEQWKKLALPVYAAVEDLVDAIVGEKVPAELKEQTKLSVFVSTFYHEIVGDYQLKTIYNCDLNARTYTGDKYSRRTKEFAHIIAAATMGVSVRILKIKELVCSSYLSQERLRPWKAFYDNLKIALADYPWINVDNFEFSVGY